MAQKHTDEEIRDLFKKHISHKKKKEIASTISTAHNVLDGRFKPGDEKQECKSGGKFFSQQGGSPLCETPREKPQDIIPSNEFYDLYDSGEDSRAV